MIKSVGRKTRPKRKFSPLQSICSSKSVSGWLMKSHVVYSLKLTALITLAGSLFSLPALAAPNIYTNTSSGKWEVSTYWSLGAPSTSSSPFWLLANGHQINQPNEPRKKRSFLPSWLRCAAFFRFLICPARESRITSCINSY
jgi:hypothetical protein